MPQVLRFYYICIKFLRNNLPQNCVFISQFIVSKTMIISQAKY